MRKRQRKKNHQGPVRRLNRWIKKQLRKSDTVTVDITLPAEVCDHKVVIDETNNSPESIAAGYVKADIFLKMAQPIQTITVTLPPPRWKRDA